MRLGKTWLLTRYDLVCMQGGTGLGAGSSLAPSASAVPEESANRYFSLAQIRARLADLSSQVGCS